MHGPRLQNRTFTSGFSSLLATAQAGQGARGKRGAEEKESGSRRPDIRCIYDCYTSYSYNDA